MQQPWKQITVKHPSVRSDLLRIFKRTGNCIAFCFLRWIKEGKTFFFFFKKEKKKRLEIARMSSLVFVFPAFFGDLSGIYCMF